MDERAMDERVMDDAIRLVLFVRLTQVRRRDPCPRRTVLVANAFARA